MAGKGVKAFLEPRGVAIVGASGNNFFSASLIQNLTRQGFPADKLYLVNPKHESVFGKTCWRSVTEVSGPVDLAVLVVPRQVVPEESAFVTHGLRGS